MPFGMEKVDGEKISKICFFVLIEYRNVMDTQTPHDHIGRACIASHSQKMTNVAANATAQNLHESGDKYHCRMVL